MRTNFQTGKHRYCEKGSCAIFDDYDGFCSERECDENSFPDTAWEECGVCREFEEFCDCDYFDG